ncbi:hypothetical protein K435DRAFT_480590 [Dendrothele bispora CBS 962.96]|uniref:Uncharacterized protein n=1 Tax=Dendrothele bispora (strain CBS 962.96) TaxID=1314807 RepID=A0A4S8MTI2_DENBC|nr:hypothetical protein K435DRAFT_480590 [Dendrothele bispora CBS 962.96]
MMSSAEVPPRTSCFRSFEPTPNFLKFINCNDAPSGTVAQALTQELEEVSSYLGDMEEQLHQSTSSSPLLTAERARISNIVSDYKVIFSPLRCFPNEILSEIFAASVGSHVEKFESDVATNSLDLHQGPWTLSRVSKKWRDVALSDSRLWRYVGFELDDTIPSHLLLELQLERSGNYPLVVYIASTWRKDFLRGHPLLSIICSQSSRWRRARLRFSEGTFAETVLPIRSSLPALEYLMLEGFPDSLVRGPAETDLFRNAPRLTSLTTNLTGRYLASFDLPWPQITRWLNVGNDIDPEFILRVLSEGQDSLRILSLALGLFYPRTTPTPLRLSQLHTLWLTLYLPPSRQILDVLTVPGLRVLRLQGKASSQPSFILFDAVSQFLERSGCTLEVLCLEIGPQPSTAMLPHEADYAAFFRMKEVASLRKLIMDGWTSRSALEALDANTVLHTSSGDQYLNDRDISLPEEIDVLLPNLTELALYEGTYERTIVSELKIIKNRLCIPRVQRLQTLRFSRDIRTVHRRGCVSASDGNSLSDTLDRGDAFNREELPEGAQENSVLSERESTWSVQRLLESLEDMGLKIVFDNEDNPDFGSVF